MSRFNIAPLLQLAQTLRGADFGAIKSQAAKDNPWFTEPMIDYAVQAILHELLDERKLREWLSSYDRPHSWRAGRVGIVAAGNLPMVGFYDLLCAVAVGHSVSLKCSSKDDILMAYVAQVVDWDVELTTQIDPYDVDMVLATGGDGAMEYFRSHFTTIPLLLRGHKESAAIVSTELSGQQVALLADDMFLYWGRGCRSVSHLFVESGVDVAGLVEALAAQGGRFALPAFRDNYRYQRARFAMQGQGYLDGGFFLLCPPLLDVEPALGVVYLHNGLPSDEQIASFQCVVGPGFTPYGQGQHPALSDAPDGVDVVDFLLRSF
ncbi:MAG: hypothetical protein RR329_00110 [Mucinivorans sp.]